VPKPGAIEVKKVQAPVGIACDSDSKLLNGELSIWNKYLALTLDHLEFCWELTASGEVIHSGILSPPSVKPGGKGILRVPFELPEEPAPGVEYWLNVRGRQPEATPWSAPGHVVAWEQFLLPWSAGTRVAPSTERKPVTIVDDGRSVALGAGNTHIVFSKNTGSLSTYKVGGKDLLSRPLEHAFMRAITDNDYIIGNPDSYYKEWEAAGATRLRASVLAFHYGQEKDGCVLLRVTTRHLAEGLKNGISVDSAYWVTSDGRIRIENVVKMDHAFPLVPRIGMQCGIPSGFEKLTWYGRGPHESYCDRKRSAMVGIHASTVVDQFFPFVDPCECGGHEDTRWMELKDAAGSTLKVTGEPVVHFSALHYTREDLMQAGHVYELKGTDNVILAIDGFHMGLGGDTGWTRNVHPEFLLRKAGGRHGGRPSTAESPGFGRYLGGSGSVPTA
jgi:beta-galactosidase